MPVNKVEYNGNTLIDLTNDTVTSEDLPTGVTAHDMTGRAISGTTQRVQYFGSKIVSEPGWYRFARNTTWSNNSFIVDIQKRYNNDNSTSVGALFSLGTLFQDYAETQLYNIRSDLNAGITDMRIVADSSDYHTPFSIDFYYGSTVSNDVRITITNLSMNVGAWTIYRDDEIVKVEEEPTNVPIVSISFRNPTRGLWAYAATCDKDGNGIPETYAKIDRTTRIHYISEEEFDLAKLGYGDTIIVNQDVTIINPGAKNLNFIVAKGATLTMRATATSYVNLIDIADGGTVLIPNNSAWINIGMLVTTGSGKFTGEYSAMIKDFLVINTSQTMRCADLYGTISLEGFNELPIVIANTISATLRTSAFYEGWFKVYVEGCVYTTKGPKILEASS